MSSFEKRVFFDRVEKSRARARRSYEPFSTLVTPPKRTVPILQRGLVHPLKLHAIFHAQKNSARFFPFFP